MTFPTNGLQWCLDPNNARCVGSLNANNNYTLNDVYTNQGIAFVSDNSIVDSITNNISGPKYFSFGETSTSDVFESQTGTPIINHYISISHNEDITAFKNHTLDHQNLDGGFSREGTFLIWIYVSDQVNGETIVMTHRTDNPYRSHDGFVIDGGFTTGDANGSLSWKPYYNGFTHRPAITQAIPDPKIALDVNTTSHTNPNTGETETVTGKWYCYIYRVGEGIESRYGIPTAGHHPQGGHAGFSSVFLNDSSYVDWSDPNNTEDKHTHLYDKTNAFINGEIYYVADYPRAVPQEKGFDYIGGHPDVTTDSLDTYKLFRGKIGPVALWDRYLTDDEVDDAFNQWRRLYLDNGSA